MKYRKYNGDRIVLASRDGHLSNKVDAIALVPVEDYDNYSWFFCRVLNHGFTLTTSPVFSDRNAGLVSAAEKLNIFIMLCIRHIWVRNHPNHQQFRSTLSYTSAQVI